MLSVCTMHRILIASLVHLTTAFGVWPIPQFPAKISKYPEPPNVYILQEFIMCLVIVNFLRVLLTLTLVLLLLPVVQLLIT